MVAAPIAREAGNHMNAYCVVTVDGIRARFFCLEKSEQTGIGASQFLVEQPEALINTALALPAEKQLRGSLRNALNAPPKASVEVMEEPKHVSRLSPQELQSHLAAEGE